MAAVGAALLNKVLGHSEAEKAFRPWWDSLEDYLIYGLVMIGVVLVPTAIITGTPLDCNYCQADFCGANFSNGNLSDPKFNLWWVKKFCTYNGSVHDFLLYYPYFLLFLALILFALERIFLKTFKAGNKLDKFYNLLVKEKILGVTGDELGGAATDGDHDGGVEALELRFSFKHSNSYFYTYLARTGVETVVAVVLLVYMCWEGLTILSHSDTIICDAHGFYYECHGSPTSFYLYTLYVTLAITVIYILCNIYNLLWLLVPNCGRLARVMSAYQQNMREREGVGADKTDQQILGDLYDIYYHNRDLGLLLNLLATSTGVAPAIAMMTLFDKDFRSAMRPEIQYAVVSRDLGIAEIRFQVAMVCCSQDINNPFKEPKTGVRAALSGIPGVSLIYLAEICPPVETAVEAFHSKHVSLTDSESGWKVNRDGDIEMVPLRGGDIQTALFTGFKKDIKYIVKVRTVLNGKTISQVSQEIKDQKSFFGWTT